MNKNNEKYLFFVILERMIKVERYSWMIILSLVGIVDLICFFYFTFKDKKKLNLLNYSLLLIVVICIVLSVYLYFDVQKQINLLEKIM